MDLIEKFHLINLTILFIAVVIALFTAVQSKKAAQKNANATAGNFLIRLREKYSSPLMKKHIRLLVDFYFIYKNDDFAMKFVERQKSDDKYDEARRMFKFYFVEIFDLCKVKVLDNKHLNILLHAQNVKILLQIIEPIEMKMNPNPPQYDLNLYEFYRKKFPKAKISEIKNI